MIMAKLNLEAALATSGSVPENVNFALKSSLLLAFLESVSSLVGRLKPPRTTPKRCSRSPPNWRRQLL